MTAYFTAAFVLTAALSSAAGTNTSPPGPADPIQTVIVGGGTSLGFNPPILQVGQGSRVHFDFRAINHTLTESTFQSPCTKLFGTDIDTDFNNPNPSDIPNLHPFDYTFASNKPRFFYCKQGAGTSDSHCRRGEVFAVNVDQATFAEFQRRAMSTPL
ncbi:hypothetical protein ETB97_007698 [Aspergillus alliaceus]|uniref:Extracellular serine-rich protein n=1 Tax=Petromyces alliaceus TaxID=209559 RepID=A0A8H5ZV33_PETAA|nr:hypothetical protein ETB97_007698 [Aspergillus burnettii]